MQMCTTYEDVLSHTSSCSCVYTWTSWHTHLHEDVLAHTSSRHICMKMCVPGRSCIILPHSTSIIHERSCTETHTHTCVVWYINVHSSYLCRDSFTSVPWRIHMCDLTHPQVRHAAFTCVCNDVSIFATRLKLLKKERDLPATHSYVWLTHICDSTRFISMCDMTLPCVWHDSFKRVTRLIHICDMAHVTCGTWSLFICVTLPLLTHVTWSIHLRDMILSHVINTYKKTPFLTHSYMCDMIHSYAWRDSLTCD